MSAEHKPYVTITNGLRGYFAVLLIWCDEHGGFYEPWNTSDASFGTYSEAIPDALAWAQAEGIEARIHG